MLSGYSLPKVLFVKFLPTTCCLFQVAACVAVFNSVYSKRAFSISFYVLFFCLWKHICVITVCVCITDKRVMSVMMMIRIMIIIVFGYYNSNGFWPCREGKLEVMSSRSWLGWSNSFGPVWCGSGRICTTVQQDNTTRLSNRIRLHHTILQRTEKQTFVRKSKLRLWD